MTQGTKDKLDSWAGRATLLTGIIVLATTSVGAIKAADAQAKVNAQEAALARVERRIDDIDAGVRDDVRTLKQEVNQRINRVDEKLDAVLMQLTKMNKGR